MSRARSDTGRAIYAHEPERHRANAHPERAPRREERRQLRTVRPPSVVFCTSQLQRIITASMFRGRSPGYVPLRVAAPAGLDDLAHQRAPAAVDAAPSPTGCLSYARILHLPRAQARAAPMHRFPRLPLACAALSPSSGRSLHRRATLEQRADCPEAPDLRHSGGRVLLPLEPGFERGCGESLSLKMPLPFHPARLRAGERGGHLSQRLKTGAAAPPGQRARSRLIPRAR
ncbi:hypothetical protein DFH09DRAFT_1280943 [Mycena vulgaris]|nr:hypothetical protein DFH09DRAFT_1280943 [Mycena vulgaris]